MKKEKSCGAIVYKDDFGERKFLAIHQLHGHWTFPKGHMEQGEDEFATAQREVYEETNVNIDFIQGFRRVNQYSPMPSVLKDVVFFLAKALDWETKAQLEEVCEVRWLSEEEIKGILTYSSDVDIFKEALVFLKENPDKTQV